jgi:citrate lyase subunit beta/citryl-CoA lyase
VRVNALGTPWHDEDLEAVAVAGLDGVCLPKVEASGEVVAVAARLDGLEAAQGLPPGSIRIVATIESARALIQAPVIAAAHRRVAALMLGAEDLALDLGLGSDRSGPAGELLYPRSAMVVAAAAARVLSIDGVFPYLDDPAGLAADAAFARALGFTSKATVHPDQVAEINRAFSPPPEEIAHARAVVDGFRRGQTEGAASVTVGGQLVDRPVLARAERLLAIAARLGLEP